MRITPTHVLARVVAALVTLLTLNAAFTSPARAAEFFVNNASASCSPSGPGTATAPFCTIMDALTAHHEPGVIITVMPGRYREQVTVPASGVAGSPITLRAQPGSAAGAVIVDGTDDFSDPALWAQSSGNVWVAASVTTAPKQVFADDQRLTLSTASPASLPSRSFTFVAGSGLFVNAGGGNPGTHRAQVGRRVRGFFASGRSFVVIQGFAITRCEDRCVQLTNSSNIVVDGNTLTFSGSFGFQASGDSADRIVANVSANHAGHGFSIVNRTVELTLENNEAFANADPNVRVANGVFLSTGSQRNTIRNNRWHDNQDSGEQFSPGAADNVSIQNRSWANGDHGYDHNGATGTIHINDVAYANFKDGFSIEGSSTGTRLFNAIATENGVTQNEYDLFVDSTSTPGLQSNDNLLWNSGPQPPVKVSQSVYPTVSGYAAGRNEDTRTVQADPLFVDPAHGDFHLRAGSPAIDNANSSAIGWPSTDAEGHARADDPGTPNRGLGSVTFADRGALEFLGTTSGTNQPPVARLTASPASGTAPLAVQLSAAASSDADGHVVSYSFAFGDGNTVGPQTSATASHTYAAGHWTATVTVTDDKGATASATATVDAAAPGNQPPVARLTASPASGTAPLAVQLSAAASSDADGHVVSYSFAFGDGNTVGPQTSATASHTYAAGHWTATVTVTDDKGATASATATVDAAAPGNQPPVARLTASPASGTAPLAVQLSAAASSDADGHVVSYSFAFGDGNTVGPQTSATASHTYAAGHWTATVTVTDDKGATSSATATVDAAAPGNQPPVARLTASPASGTAPLAVQLSAAASSDADGHVVSYFFEFGDGNTVGPQTSATAGHTYAAGHWTARVTVKDDKGATASASATVDAAAPANQPPVARLTASPASGTAPLAVQLSAAASSDADGHVVSYRFEFGDGNTAGPQTSATASHTYGAGHWTAKVTVTDDKGATAAAFASVSVSSPPSNLVGNPSFESGTTGWAAVGGASIRIASGGHTGSFSLLASSPLLSLSAYGITDSPDWVQHTAGAGTRYHVRAWARTEIGVGLVSLAVRETGTGGSFQFRSSSIQLGTGWAALDLDVTTQMNDSRLDLSILNAPSLLGTAFRVDDVSIVQGGGEPALVTAADDGAPPPPADDPFLAPGVHPNPMRADGARIVFATGAGGPAQIQLFDLAGRVVRQLDGDPAAPAGPQSVVFDGRGDDGQRLPGGVYYYQVRAAGTLTRGRLVIVQ